MSSSRSKTGVVPAIVAPQDQKRKWIQDYIDSGYALLPYLDGRKFTVAEGWQHTKPDMDASPDDFPFNYGIVLQRGEVVIDVDPRNFKNGVDSWAKLQADLGITDPKLLLGTYQVRTGGGGLHIYFSKNPAVALRKYVRKADQNGQLQKCYPGIEILSKGHQVVGPGSIHPDTGKRYEVINGSPDKLLPAPPALYEIFERKENEHIGVDFVDDSAANQQNYADWLRMIARPAIQGDNGDDLTIATALKGRDMGLSEAITADLMARFWNPKCQPPWDMDGLQKKVANAYRYPQRPAGNRNGASLLTPVDIDESERTDADIWAEKREQMMTRSGLKWDLKYRKIDGERVAHGFRDTLANALNFFRWGNTERIENPLASLVRWNILTNEIEFTRKAPWHTHPVNVWSDEDTDKFREYVNDYMSGYTENFERWDPPINLVWSAVRNIAYDNAYHPMRDYLQSLTWDGVPRVRDLFIRYVGAMEEPYIREAGKCLMVAMVARSMYDYTVKNGVRGVKYDNVVVLEGAQGIGKSRFCAVLGGERTVEISYLHSNAEKAITESIRGKLVAEIVEMAHARKAEYEWVKGYISKVSDNYRTPYDRVAKDHPRSCVFIGTFNPGHDSRYLMDQTGNRRFWPISCGEIDIDSLERDRDQLFAEAYYMYMNGEPWHMTDTAAIEGAKRAQDSRTAKEVWTGELGARLAEMQKAYSMPVAISGSGVLDLIGVPPHQRNRHAAERATAAMVELGWRAYRQDGDMMYAAPDDI